MGREKGGGRREKGVREWEGRGGKGGGRGRKWEGAKKGNGEVMSHFDNNPNFQPVSGLNLLDNSFFACIFIYLFIFHFQDRYIIGSMTFNWLVCLWHAIVSRFDNNPNYQSDLDFWAFIVLIILYVLFQIVFYLLVLIKVGIYMSNVMRKRAVRGFRPNSNRPAQLHRLARGIKFWI